jgi:hypothetical protein
MIYSEPYDRNALIRGLDLVDDPLFASQAKSNNSKMQQQLQDVIEHGQNEETHRRGDSPINFVLFDTMQGYDGSDETSTVD